MAAEFLLQVGTQGPNNHDVLIANSPYNAGVDEPIVVRRGITSMEALDEIRKYLYFADEGKFPEGYGKS